MFRKLLGLACKGSRRLRCDSRPAPAARRGRRAPRLEALEPRTAPAVNVYVLDGVLTVLGDAAADTITIDHDPGTTTVTRSAPAPFTLPFSDDSFTRIEINTGHGSDTVHIRALPSFFIPPDTIRWTTINSAGPEPDTVNLGGPGLSTSALSGVVSIGAAGGNPTININDSGNDYGRSVSLSDANGQGFISGLIGSGFILFRSNLTRAMGITLGSGRDSFTFNDTPNGPTVLDTGPGFDDVHVRRTRAPLTLMSNGGADRVFVGNPTDGVRGILGAVTVTNTFDDTFLDIDNGADTVGRNVVHDINPVSGFATLSGLAPAAISYRATDLWTLNVTLGSGGDTVLVGNTVADRSTALDTGAGNDAVTVQRTDGQLSVAGGPGGDTVTLGGAVDLASPRLSVNGGPDRDALNYTAHAANLYVNLRTGQATGLTSLTGVEDIHGGSGNDVLVGNGGNWLSGGRGRDVLIAGSAPSELIGDFFEDEGEDILIAGTTIYDTDAAALTALRDYWANPRLDYDTRVLQLRRTTLNADTVTHNGGPNSLQGGGGRDFVFLRPDVDRFDGPEAGEVVVPI